MPVKWLDSWYSSDPKSSQTGMSKCSLKLYGLSINSRILNSTYRQVSYLSQKMYTSLITTTTSVTALWWLPNHISKTCERPLSCWLINVLSARIIYSLFSNLTTLECLIYDYTWENNVASVLTNNLLYNSLCKLI